MNNEDTTPVTPAEKPASRFTLLKADALDPMKEYRDAASIMEIGDGYNLMPKEAVLMAKAIVALYGDRTVRVETYGAGKRVIRVAARPLVPRKPRTAKKAAK